MSIYHDDHAGFDRPRRRSRPRTKDRPDYSDAPVARVVSIDRGRYRLDLDGHPVTAVRGRLIPRKGVIVGDSVRLDGDVSGDEGTLARIVQVEERSTMLRRSALGVVNILVAIEDAFGVEFDEQSLTAGAALSPDVLFDTVSNLAAA